jgi:hypothetical protein
LISVPDKPSIADFASSWVDMTTNPRLLDALSTVARITQCETFPKHENIEMNSDLVYCNKDNGCPRWDWRGELTLSGRREDQERTNSCANQASWFVETPWIME